jgi:hypothetical protein
MFMKNVLFAALMFASMPAFAQKINEAKLPASVKSTFSSNFSGVTDVKWEKEKGNYEANFSQGWHKMAALIDANGKLLETETGIAVNELPASAASYVQQHYKGKKIKESARIKLASGETNYEAAIQGKDLIFDEKGNFLREAKQD